MDKKIWFVTGASSGLGKAMVETIIKKGDYAIGTFRKEEQVVQFNSQNKGNGEGVLLDITDLKSIEEVISKTLGKHGKIDVLVNNAGVGFCGAIEEAAITEIRQIFEANFFGTLKLTQAVLPSMRQYKSGHIVQISSHAGVKSTPGFGIYNASKFALEGFSEALDHEVKPLGIKVAIVEPGPFRTNFAGGSLKESANEISDYAETAGAFRKKLKSVHDKQEGHPVKAAEAIVDHVYKKDATLRLPLGKIPLTTIGMKIDSLKSDLEANKEVAASAVYE